MALRRLRNDRALLSFGVLFVLLVVAPLYARRWPERHPADNQLRDEQMRRRAPERVPSPHSLSRDDQRFRVFGLRFETGQAGAELT